MFTPALPSPTVVLALLWATASADKDKGWSWGAEEAQQAKEEQKIPPAAAAPQEEGRSFSSFHQEGDVPEISASQFVEPLPLEPHSADVEAHQHQLDVEGHQHQLEGHQHQLDGGALLAAGDNSNREARFLGLSDTLCRWGVGSGVRTYTYFVSCVLTDNRDILVAGADQFPITLMFDKISLEKYSNRQRSKLFAHINKFSCVDGIVYIISTIFV